MARSWQAAKLATGITRRIPFYHLRHFYITHALAQGADILNLTHRVGYKNANMIVNVYAHLVDELREKEAYKLPAVDFKAIEMPKKVVSMGDNRTRQKIANDNNFTQLDKNGRGGRI